jgi:D-3-phosphoglycerate dehydrogenase
MTTIPTLTHLWLEAPLFPHVIARLPAGVAVVDALPPPAVPYANGAACEAIVASSLLRYDGEVLDAFPALRLIARTGIGLDNVDLAAATARGIVVTNTPDGPTESTAEHTVAMLLALAKRLKQGNDNLAAGQWGPRDGALIGDEVYGKTLGLVGLGRIGRRVAAICRAAFAMRVVACDPVVTPEQATALGVQLVATDEVFAQADFVSLHVPATPETHHVANRARLALMKPGAYLLNMARGPLVDAEALLEALDAGRLAGAGLDVFDPEPPAVLDRVRSHPHIVATPHIASLTREGRERMEVMAVERVLAFFTGAVPPDVANREVLTR